MGTRGLLGLIIHGRRKGIYNHLDSDLDEMGAAIAEFIASLTEEDRLQMIARLDQIEWVSMDAEPPANLVQRYRAQDFDYPYKSRDRFMRDMWTQNRAQVDRFEPMTWHKLLMGVQGAAALRPILDGTLGHVVDSADFAEDKTFCEWVYWVDFENQRFVVETVGRDWTFEEVREAGGWWDKRVKSKQEQDKDRRTFDREFNARLARDQADE